MRLDPASIDHVYKHEVGSTTIVDRVDPAWLRPDSGIWVWVDLSSPTPDEAKLLSEVFHFHDLAIEDAHRRDTPSEDRILRRLPLPDPARHRLQGQRTRLQDAGSRFLPRRAVPRHLSRRHLALGRPRRVISAAATIASSAKAPQRSSIASSTPWSTTTGRRSTSWASRLDTLEKEVFSRPKSTLVKRILDFKRDISSLRRVIMPQRDAVARLARREFPQISEGVVVSLP